MRSLMNAASAALLSALTARHSPLESGIGGERLDARRALAPDPRSTRRRCARLISSLSFGLLSTIQRRGVTPLVTL